MSSVIQSDHRHGCRENRLRCAATIFESSTSSTSMFNNGKLAADSTIFNTFSNHQRSPTIWHQIQQSSTICKKLNNRHQSDTISTIFENPQKVQHACRPGFHFGIAGSHCTKSRCNHALKLHFEWISLEPCLHQEMCRVCC